MADIFISYARSDREKIEKLASTLEAQGWSVWWDRQIVGGAEFSEEIEKELNAAHTVIVAWSKAATTSPWVKDEASAARDQGKLVPIQLDDGAVPMGFRQYQGVDFQGWNGDAASPAYEELARAINARQTASAAQPIKEPEAPTESKAKTSAVFIAVGLALMAATFLFMSNRQSSNNTEPRTAKDTTSISETTQQAVMQSIAVLPFADMSVAGDQEYFCDGIAEEIMTALNRIDGLRVAGRTSAFSFKGKNEDLPTIGTALRVDHILEGSIRKQNNRVRVSAQLVRAEDGTTLWSESFDRNLEDIFAIQEEIADSVASELELRLAGGEPLMKFGTDDEEAYRLYLQGRKLLSLRTGDNIPNAIKYFEEAVQRDPNFARSVSALGAAYVLLTDYSQSDNENEIIEKGEAFADQAIEMDPTLVEPYAVRSVAGQLQRDFAKAGEWSKRAFEIDPDDFDTNFWTLNLLLSVGRISEAASISKHIIDIDPVSALAHLGRAQTYLYSGDYENARTLAERGRDLGHPGAYFILPLIAEHDGETERAAELRAKPYLDGILETHLDADAINILAQGIHGNETQRQTALSFIDDYINSGQSMDEILIYLTLLRAGDASRAFELIDKHTVQHELLFLWEIWMPASREARLDPGFQGFARRARMTEYWKKFGWPDRCRPLPEAGDDAFQCD